MEEGQETSTVDVPLPPYALPNEQEELVLLAGDPYPLDQFKLGPKNSSNVTIVHDVGKFKKSSSVFLFFTFKFFCRRRNHRNVLR